MNPTLNEAALRTEADLSQTCQVINCFHLLENTILKYPCIFLQAVEQITFLLKINVEKKWCLKKIFNAKVRSVNFLLVSVPMLCNVSYR